MGSHLIEGSADEFAERYQQGVRVRTRTFYITLVRRARSFNFLRILEKNVCSLWQVGCGCLVPNVNIYQISPPDRPSLFLLMLLATHFSWKGPKHQGG